MLAGLSPGSSGTGGKPSPPAVPAGRLRAIVSRRSSPGDRISCKTPEMPVFPCTDSRFRLRRVRCYAMKRYSMKSMAREIDGLERVGVSRREAQVSAAID